MEKKIAVIDLKAFYSYVECIDRGLDPWSTPLVVADITRSVNTIILSVTPYLKSRGVPSRLRVRDLPKGYNYVYATPRMERYIEKSCEVVSIIMDFVSEEDMHVYSIDEAFIDLTTYLNFYKMDEKSLVMKILNTIKEKTGLQATAGIGENFFLAKVALDIFAKKAKDGIGLLYKNEVESKLWPISPLTKIWGIGPNLEKRLNKEGIISVRDLAHANPALIKEKFGIIGEQLIEHANGIDDSDVREVYIPKEKSFSFGQTLPRDFTKDEALVVIRELCEDLSSKIRSQNLTTSLVALSVGYSSNMGGFSKQMSLLRQTDDTEKLFKALKQIYKECVTDLPIRQIHIYFSHLEHYSEHQQLSLFSDETHVDDIRNLQLMIDEIHNKYGKNLLVRASALTKASTAIERHNQIGGHRK